MKLSEYSDDDLLQEVKRRGFEIEVLFDNRENVIGVQIGGTTFDIKRT